VLLALLSACTSEAVLSKIDPPDVDRYARVVFETFRVGTSDEALRLLYPQASNDPAMADSVRGLQREFAALGAIDSAKLVGGQFFFAVGSTPARRVLTYELWGHGTLALAQLVILEDRTRRTVDALHLQPLTRSVESTNDFRNNMSLVKLVVLLAAVGLGLFSVATALLVVRTPMRRRWLWALVALFGAGSFSMSWTNGAIKADLLSIRFLSAGIQRIGLAGPWIISAAFPIGAIVALRKRRQSLVSSANSSSSAPVVEADPAFAPEGPDATHPPDSAPLS
jgi:hypothetical protein